MTLIKKAFISYAVEHALLDIGGEKMINLVSKKLNSKYNCDLKNCYKTPQYINEVLRETYGKKYREIVQSVEENLEEFNQEKQIYEFLLKIR